ncbi:MAG TPA: hypothetical protein VNA13_00315, partial [Xanthomonadales bacterium]|nr:hypothetical protein [Xanthomonadales bacterium]
AYFPWPTVWMIVRIKNKELRIKFLPAPLSLRGASETSDAAIFSKYLIQVEGGKPMTVKDFLNGYPEMNKIISSVLS